MSSSNVSLPSPSRSLQFLQDDGSISGKIVSRSECRDTPNNNTLQKLSKLYAELARRNSFESQTSCELNIHVHCARIMQNNNNHHGSGSEKCVVVRVLDRDPVNRKDGAAPCDEVLSISYY